MVQAEDDAIAGVGRVADVAVAAQGPHLSAAHVDGEQGDIAQVAGRDEQRPSVRRPGHRARRAIPVGGQYAGRAAGPRLQDDAKAIRLVARPLHRQIRQRLAVGREDRVGVPGAVLGSDLPRLGRPIGRDKEEIEVSGPGLLAADVTGGEDEPFAVGGEGQLLRPAERLGRRIGVHPRHDVANRTVSQAHHERV